MRAQREPWLALLLALVVGLAAGCKPKSDGADSGYPPQDVDGGAVDAGSGGFLDSCTVDDDCLSHACLVSQVCSKTCQTDADCPSVVGWSCEEANGVGTCQCLPVSRTESCNGVDDNCNGTADEGATCPGQEVCQHGGCVCPPANSCGTDCVDKQTSPLHCGDCATACGPNEVCTAGHCGCPGKVCHGACAEVAFDDLNCGGCDLACAAGEECVNSQCQPIDRNWTAWTPIDQSSFGSDGPSIQDHTTGLVWATTLSGPLAHPEAAPYCAALAEGGHSDWRLPTRAELLSLVDYAEASPAIDGDFFPLTPTMSEWTATALAVARPPEEADGGLTDGGDVDGGSVDGGDVDGGEADAGGADAVVSSWWAVDFTDGAVTAYPESRPADDGSSIPTKLLVRCVR